MDTFRTVTILLVLVNLLSAGPLLDGYKLRGMFTGPDGKNRYSVYREADSRSAWVRQGRSVGNVTFLDYDVTEKTLHCTKDGVAYVLKLEESSTEVALLFEEDSNSSGETMPKKSFSSLPPDKQRLYESDPKYVPLLLAMNFEVPRDLLIKAKAEAQRKKTVNEMRNLSSSQSGSHSKSKKGRRGPGIPMNTTSLTTEEKKARELNFR